MVEEARLESSYTSKAYQGFESPSLRKRPGGRLGCKRYSFATFFAFRRQRIYSERFGIVRSADGRRPGIGRDMWLFGRSREGGPQLDLCLVCRKLGKVIIRGFEIDYPVTDEMFARPE